MITKKILPKVDNIPSRKTEADNSSFFQPNLSINPPNDIYEQEADAVADKVMRMTDDSAAQTTFFGPPIVPIQRKCTHYGEEEKKLNRKEANSGVTNAKASLESYVNNLGGSGQSLDDPVRNFYESRLGYDFSNVKVHTDSVAVESAQSINALAYTLGRNIVFNNGQYSPGSDSGKRLLAHELTHVIQQDKSPAVQAKNYLQRFPFDHGDPIHDPILDQYSRERKIPREEASQHSLDYEEWINEKTADREAFDNHQLTAQHLTDQSVQSRFSAMLLEDLLAYREEYIVNGKNDPAVVAYISNIMRGRPLQPCTPAEVQQTNQKAQAVVNGMAPMVNKAATALTRLQSAWAANKSDLLAGRAKLGGEVACAFRSNFNIDETNADFGVAMIHIESRLRQLQRKLNVPVSFSCEAINNHICLGGTGLDADGYVVNHQVPIHLCVGFRTSSDLTHQQAVIIHEFLHLLPGVDDSGGYSRLMGAQSRTCQMNFKFPASSVQATLVHTADAITGFILHVDGTSP